MVYHAYSNKESILQYTHFYSLRLIHITELVRMFDAIHETSDPSLASQISSYTTFCNMLEALRRPSIRQQCKLID